MLYSLKDAEQGFRESFPKPVHFLAKECIINSVLAESVEVAAEANGYMLVGIKNKRAVFSAKQKPE